jgi:hypothetical protein
MPVRRIAEHSLCSPGLRKNRRRTSRSAIRPRLLRSALAKRLLNWGNTSGWINRATYTHQSRPAGSYRWIVLDLTLELQRHDRRMSQRWAAWERETKQPWSRGIRNRLLSAANPTMEAKRAPSSGQRCLKAQSGPAGLSGLRRSHTFV